MPADFIVCVFSCAGVFWPTGPAGAEHVLEGVWWADWHPPPGGATGAARHCPQAAQTLEGQGSTCLNTLTNYCTSLETHSWYFINLNRKTFGFHRVTAINLYYFNVTATLSVFTCSLSSGYLVSDNFGDGTIRHCKSWILYGESHLPCFLCFVSSLCFPQDIQGEVPSHLLRLKVEVEQNRVAVIIEDYRAELDREMQALSGTCTSEQVIKEHRVSFIEI